MREWLNNIAGPQYASAVMWTAGALVLLVILLVLIRLVRSFTSGTFVAGGRNRKTRLAVMDATAVDSQRRLVLVRRDEVEHLILIGGPTDVVVEQNILPGGAVRAPRGPAGPDLAPVGPEPSAPQPTAPVERPRSVTSTPARQRTEPELPLPAAPVPATSRASDISADDIRGMETREPTALETPSARPDRRSMASASSDSTSRAAGPRPAAVSAPVAGLGSVHILETTRGAPTAAVSSDAPFDPEPAFPEPAFPESVTREEAGISPQPASQGSSMEIDAALQRELSGPLERRQDSSPDGDPSLEDEMKRLLGELSGPERK